MLKKVLTFAWLFVNVIQAFVILFWTMFCAVFVVLFGYVSPSFARWVVYRFWAYSFSMIMGAKIVYDDGGIDWKDGPRLFYANHSSNIDIPAILSHTPVPLHFIAKKSLRHFPFVGQAMVTVGTIFIDRENLEKAKKSLELAKREILENGKNLVAFPEGTRSDSGELLPFKKGAFLLALEAGIPVVPIAIDGARDRLRKPVLFSTPGPIRIKVGRPIDSTKFSYEQRDEFVKTARQALIDLRNEQKGAH